MVVPESIDADTGHTIGYNNTGQLVLKKSLSPYTGHTIGYDNTGQIISIKGSIPDIGHIIGYDNTGQIISIKDSIPDIGHTIGYDNLGQIVIPKSTDLNSGHTAGYGHTDQLLFLKSLIANTGHRVGVRAMGYGAEDIYTSGRAVVIQRRYFGWRGNFVVDAIIGREAKGDGSEACPAVGLFISILGTIRDSYMYFATSCKSITPEGWRGTAQHCYQGHS